VSRLSELEAMVQAAWNRGTQVAYGPDPAFSRDELRALFGVYADELQELGDPRGELISFDLLRTPTTEDRDRFAALAQAWLGPLSTHPNIRVRYGLVGVSITDTEPKLLAEFLATRGGAYLSSVAVFGDVFTVRTTISTLAAEVRPWLGALRIVVPSPPLGATRAQPMIEPELATQLVDATPALYSLSISGRNLLRDFPHPGLRKVVVDNQEDLGAIVTGAPLPAVTELDLAVSAISSRLLPATSWPALRKLDLSRNEPAVIRVLQTCGVRDQLTHVRLPALRTQEDRDLLNAIRQQRPALEIDIPPMRPWDAPLVPLVLAFDGEEAMVDPRALISVMERVYDRLPVDARVAWDDFWSLAISGGEFPASTLAEALDACGDALVDPQWRYATDLLAQHPDAMVEIAPL
jgi:hypothetical protein